MSTPLEILTSKNLLGRKGPKKSAVSSLSLSRIIDIAEETEESIRNGHKRIDTSIVSHSVSLDECNGINCRLERIDRLARFTLMYSDKLYLPSFFYSYSGEPTSIFDIRGNVGNMRERLYNDARIVYEIRHLLQSEHISFFSPLRDVCFSCQAKTYLGEKIGAQFNKKYKKLQNEYLKQMSVQCAKVVDNYIVTVDCPYPYLDHGYGVKLKDIPRPLFNQHSLVDKILKGDNVLFPKSLIKQFKLHVGAAHQVATNAIHGLVTSACLRTSFLTEQDIHILFLNSLHSNLDISRKNEIALKHLSAIVPFINDVDLKNLIKLRNRERESFLSFRHALGQAIGNFATIKGEFTEKDARCIHADIIAPSLASLDRKVRSAKRDLVTKPIRSILGIVGVISFGLFTGLLPENLSQIAKVLGLLKFGSDTLKEIMAAGDKERSIENESFYFLWKVKQKVRY